MADVGAPVAGCGTQGAWDGSGVWDAAGWRQPPCGRGRQRCCGAGTAAAACTAISARSSLIGPLKRACRPHPAHQDEGQAARALTPAHTPTLAAALCRKAVSHTHRSNISRSDSSGTETLVSGTKVGPAGKAQAPRLDGRRRPRRGRGAGTLAAQLRPAPGQLAQAPMLRARLFFPHRLTHTSKGKNARPATPSLQSPIQRSVPQPSCPAIPRKHPRICNAACSPPALKPSDNNPHASLRGGRAPALSASCKTMSISGRSGSAGEKSTEARRAVSVAADRRRCAASARSACTRVRRRGQGSVSWQAASDGCKLPAGRAAALGGPPPRRGATLPGGRRCGRRGAARRAGRRCSTAGAAPPPGQSPAGRWLQGRWYACKGCSSQRGGTARDAGKQTAAAPSVCPQRCQHSVLPTSHEAVGVGEGDAEAKDVGGLQPPRKEQQHKAGQAHAEQRRVVHQVGPAGQHPTRLTVEWLRRRADAGCEQHSATRVLDQACGMATTSCRPVPPGQAKVHT